MPELIEQRLEECYALAQQHFGRSLNRPQFNLQLRGQAAGVAHLQRNLIRFNAVLYRQNQQHFLQQTVAHEAAHLIAHQLFGQNIRPHGVQWQSIMREVFGLPPERCHSYQLPPVRRTLYDYACGCMEHALSAQRHGRIRRGYAYQCRKCHQSLEFTGTVRSVLVER